MRIFGPAVDHVSAQLLEAAKAHLLLRIIRFGSLRDPLTNQEKTEISEWINSMSAPQVINLHHLLEAAGYSSEPSP